MFEILNGKKIHTIPNAHHFYPVLNKISWYLGAGVTYLVGKALRYDQI